jgi:hypothetical protein
VEKRIRELKEVLQLIEKDRRDNPNPSKSYSTVCHTLALYNISSEEASVLIQARIGFCRLDKSLFASVVRVKSQYNIYCSTA